MTTNNDQTISGNSAISRQENKVLTALNNTKYKWRTINGISDEVSLNKDVVKDSIDDLTNKGLLIVSSSTTSNGEPLYTTKSNYRSGKFFFNRIMSALSDTVK